MSKIVVYLKPTCTISRKVVKTLTEKGVGFDKMDYYKTPFAKKLLSDLLKKMNLKPSDLLRKKEKAYKDLNLKNKNYTEDQLINIMVNNPDLIERPIVAKGNKVVLARPAESVNDIL